MMAIHCLFFTPGASQPPCQVLRALKTPSLLASTQQQLEKRYCTSGGFLACPIFARVEAGLTEANRLRRASDEHPQLHLHVPPASDPA